MNERATLTEIQSIRQKMVEAYHIQRQYKTILDVISGERIGYESQLTELEKSIAESKAEVAKLKVFHSMYIGNVCNWHDWCVCLSSRALLNCLLE